MLLTKKIKLHVTEHDAATLEFMQGKARGLYNWWVMRLKNGEHWPGWRKAKKTLQASKQYDPELTQVYGKLLHEVYFRLDAAMQAFFRRAANGEAPGFPRVRPRHCFFTLIYPAMYLKRKGKILTLPTGGKGKNNKQYPNIRAELTEAPPEGYREVAISRDARGNYFACFSYPATEQEAQAGGIVAFDLGVKTLAAGVTQQGRRYHIGGFKGGRWYNKQLDKLRSKRERCHKKSRRYLHLSKVYQRVAENKRNKQRDSLHKASHLIAAKLVERTVVIGDLSQRQMAMRERAKEQPNHGKNRAVFNDWGCYTFTQMLAYKCRLSGKELVKLDERNTSKMCSRCGHLQDMPLWKRTYRCENCGLVLDRDDNSADNILARFLARRGPHTSSGECGVWYEDQNGVEVTEASCPILVPELKLW